MRAATWAWVIPCVFAALVAPRLLQPISGSHHKWRQADTAAVARNLAFESADPFHPRIDLRGSLSGVTGMEFPLYNALVAVPMALTRTDDDAWGKLVSLAMGVLAWALLVRLLVARFGVEPWTAHVACAAVPAFSGYVDKVMPETTALFLAVLALERFSSWWSHARTRDLVLATVAISLAGLVRPYMLAAGVPMVAFVIAGERARAPRVVLAGVVALVPVAAWYAWWCPHLVAAYGIDYFFQGHASPAALLDPGTWTDLLDVTSAFYLKRMAWPVVAVGAFMLLRHVHGAWSWTFAVAMPAVSVIAMLVVVGRHFQPHVYYLAGAAPACVLLVALGLHGLAQKHVGLGAAGAALVLVAAWRTWSMHFDPTDPELDALRPVATEVSARTNAADLFVVEDRGARPWYLHVLRRRGWAEPRATLENADAMRSMQQQGARWVVATRNDTWMLFPITEWTTP